MSPWQFDYRQLTTWLRELCRTETHRAEHYDLAVDLDGATGAVEVRGSVRLRPRAGHPNPAGEHGTPRSARVDVRFLLNPDLELLEPAEGPEAFESTAASAADDQATTRRALRTATVAAGAEELRLHYRGRLPGAWISPESAELALYDLWYPIFSGALEPFTFRVLLRVPPEAVPAMNGRLVPLPADLAPREHDDVSPRAYLWESVIPAMDIAACAGPYLVHEGVLQGGAAEAVGGAPRVAGGPVGSSRGTRMRQPDSLRFQVYTLGDDYGLAEPFLSWASRVYKVLLPWFGPLGPEARVLRIVIPPASNWGGYTRPGYLLMPSPMATKIRDPVEEKAIALWLAHEMAHLWFGSKVLSDTVREAWMSEGFAEFGRLVFEQAQWGEAAYRERLARYTELIAAAAQAAPPLPMRKVGTDHPEMDALARRRGGLMLAGLRDIIGDRTMACLLTGFAAKYDGKMATTEDFVAEVVQVTGETAPVDGGAARVHRSAAWVVDPGRVTGREVTAFLASYLDRVPGPGKGD